MDNKDKFLEKEPIDIFTDYGKGFRFYTCDGRQVATMDEVMEYNKSFYDKMIIKTPTVTLPGGYIVELQADAEWKSDDEKEKTL